MLSTYFDEISINQVNIICQVTTLVSMQVCVASASSLYRVDQ